MEFNSLVFIVFLLAVVSLNFMLPLKLRSPFLLAASFIFVGLYNPASLLVLVVLATANFLTGLYIRQKQALYFFSLLINVSAILLFNYFSLSAGKLVRSTAMSFDINSFVLALGLSYYSLQNIAYLTEIYFSRLSPERNLLRFLLYTAFFPKVISGPVMLPKEFLSQQPDIREKKELIVQGAQRFLLGLFKKMVLADRLAPAVHSIFDYDDTYPGITVLIGAYVFTLQLYFDFSGYSDMAVGIAKMLGYDLRENFNLPLRSQSISEFWRRWHISLISWFSTYIYYPLAFRMRKYGRIATVTAICATFLISAFWHGLSLTFLCWGICHMLYLCFELFSKTARRKLSQKVPAKLYAFISVLLVFNLVCFSNIFFRSGSFDRALLLVNDLFIFRDFFPASCAEIFSPIAVGWHQADQFNLIITMGLVIVFLFFERRISSIFMSTSLNFGAIVLLILLIMLFGVFTNAERFIYMQF
jgi:D-alanyl-lipoteichoic acid acyltransferase DltB (MBOAT superfamily)